VVIDISLATGNPPAQVASRGLAGNLILSCAASGEFQQEFHTKARAANARLAPRMLELDTIRSSSIGSFLAEMT
jgi:hypothetical protein